MVEGIRGESNTAPRTAAGVPFRLANGARRIWVWLFVAVAAYYCVWYLRQNVETLHQANWLDPRWMVLSIGVYAAYWAVATFIWRLTLREVSGIRQPFGQSLLQLVLVSLGKYVPGKIWGITARGAQLGRSGITWTISLQATLLEQMVMLHAAFLLCTLLYAVTVPSAVSLSLSVVALLSSLMGRQIQRSLIAPINWLAARYFKRSQLTTGITQVGTLPYVRLLAAFMASWFLIGLVFATLYYAAFPKSWGLTLTLILIQANTIGVVAGFLALFAPGGMGVREAVTSGVLSMFVALPDAVFASVLFRLLVVSVELSGGLFVILLVRPQPKESDA
jgi:uncharacterized membrane protein YbhN (UPF0104 family)